LILLFRHSKIHAEMRYRIDSLDERNAVVERLREFIRLNYVTGADVAKRIGFRDEMVYSWLAGKSRPAEPERVTAFLDSLPAEKSGFAPTGYEYREIQELARYPEAAPLPVLQAG
jgi:hypothetical protein